MTALPAETPGLRPRRRLRRPMVLTPLVDIVFLLLTFFMLSSQLTPFSLLALDGQRGVGTVSSATAPASARPDALLSVGKGQVRLNGRTIASGALLSQLRAEAAGGTTRVTILASADATVQDFVAVLEAAKTAAFPSIAVANMR